MERKDVNKNCPHCSAALPESASFCPHCAKSVNQRTSPVPPRHMPRRALYSALLIVFVLGVVLALAVWRDSRPQTYESDTGEVIYSDHRLCFSGVEPPVPVPQNSYHAMLDYPYRYPVPLYVTPLTDAFMENVASITAEINCSEIYMTMTCTEPQQHNEYYPNAAAVTFVDFSIVAPGEYEAELICTITMKNGDVIRMHQKQRHSSISVYKYTAQDAPMNTIEELQAFVDKVSAEIDEYDQLHLYLPAVVYEGGLKLGRSVNLYGSIGPDGQRTTFTGPTEMSYALGVPEFNDIAFQGSGQGVGGHASGTVGSIWSIAGCPAGRRASWPQKTPGSMLTKPSLRTTVWGYALMP